MLLYIKLLNSLALCVCPIWSNPKAMMENKGKAVKGLSGGIEFLFKKNKVSQLMDQYQSFNQLVSINQSVRSMKAPDQPVADQSLPTPSPPHGHTSSSLCYYDSILFRMDGGVVIYCRKLIPMDGLCCAVLCVCVGGLH